MAGSAPCEVGCACNRHRTIPGGRMIPRQDYQREYQRRYTLAQYGLTPEEFDGLRADQDGRCAICTDPFTETPNVDHDHTDGHVRGLLCTDCNISLGRMKDNPARLRAAAQYLEDTRS